MINKQRISINWKCLNYLVPDSSFFFVCWSWVLVWPQWWSFVDVSHEGLDFKGQLISKRFFEVVVFLQKTNENNSHSSKNEFIRSFFGGNRWTQKPFRNYLTFRLILFFTFDLEESLDSIGFIIHVFGIWSIIFIDIHKV